MRIDGWMKYDMSCITKAILISIIFVIITNITIIIIVNNVVVAVVKL